MKLKGYFASLLTFYCASQVLCSYTGDNIEAVDQNASKEGVGLSNRSGTDSDSVPTTSTKDWELFKDVPINVKDTKEELEKEAEAILGDVVEKGGPGKKKQDGSFEDEKDQKRALVRKSKLRRWINAAVYWRYDNVNELSKEFQTDIKAAMLEISRKTCIRFIYTDGKGDKNGCILKIVKGTDKRCYVKGGVGRLRVLDDCDPSIMSLDPNKCKMSAIMHEILHVIGFHHEHQRPNRDLYVEFNPEPALKKLINQDKENLVDIEPKDDVSDLKSKYDYFSIMHYMRYFHVKSNNEARDRYKYLANLNGKQNEENDFEMKATAMRDQLSVTDIIKINEFYGCVDCKDIESENICKTRIEEDKSYCDNPYKLDHKCLGSCKFKCVDEKEFKNFQFP